MQYDERKQNCCDIGKLLPEVSARILDADGNPFDGAKTYKVTLPKDIPARAFWEA